VGKVQVQSFAFSVKAGDAYNNHCALQVCCKVCKWFRKWHITNI